MKNLITVTFWIFFLTSAFGQNKVTVSLVGSVTNFNTSEEIFGATLYMIQNGKTISKSISDETGNYSLSGTLNPAVPFDLLVSKPGYASKKVLFELEKLKLKNNLPF